MINSSSENMMRFSSVFTPADVSPKLRMPRWHDSGPCNKADSSAVNDVDLKTSRGQTEECESREVTQHYNCFFVQFSSHASNRSGGLECPNHSACFNL